MGYARIKTSQFFDLIKTEVESRDWVWRSRFGGKDFVCPECGHEKYWQHKARCEIRECQSCQHRAKLKEQQLSLGDSEPDRTSEKLDETRERFGLGSSDVDPQVKEILDDIDAVDFINKLAQLSAEDLI